VRNTLAKARERGITTLPGYEGGSALFSLSRRLPRKDRADDQRTLSLLIGLGKNG
jgi:hypothetical protein